jgi:phage replication O-like protein O
MTDNHDDEQEKPRKRGGFTMVANALLEPGATKSLSGLQHRVLNMVMRMTTGWQKPAMTLEMAGIARYLKTDRRSVQRAFKVLQARGIIKVFTEPGVRQNDRMARPIARRCVAICPQFVPKSAGKNPQHNKERNIKKENKERASFSQSSKTVGSDPYRPITRDDVVKALEELSAVLVIQKSLGGTLTDAMCDNFWSALRKMGWGVLRLRELCRIARQSCRFFPTVADLLDIANQNPGIGRPPDTTSKLKPEDMPTEEEFKHAMAELKKVINF